MNCSQKKAQVLRVLNEVELSDIFEVRVDEKDRVLIQGQQNMGNGRCVISLDLQDRPYHSIYFSMGKLTNLARKDAILDLFNSFNDENLLLKFYISNDNSMMAQVMYIAREDNFNADEYISLIRPAFMALEDNFYGKIMRVIWG